ncbi:general transcription factor IIH subunit 4-like, partial [Pollicipes pollicipes]|uniref:general transcription factor IIH subunit 4-like n=1 Tax=Pollicipes pollicipes TaxID=41117 RepID=UPI0018858142
MRLLFVEQPIPKAVTTSWVDTSHAKEVSLIAESLIQLHIWHEVQLPGGLPGWLLNDVFRKNVRVCLLEGGVSQGLRQCQTPDPYHRSVEALDTYA